MKYAFLALVLFLYTNFQTGKNQPGSLENIVEGHQTSPKAIAFEVLKTKCNTCHATKKKTDVFTLENMDSLAADIHKQVFIKKKMPKGRKIKLTEEETDALARWLETVLPEQTE
ncbi:c-type cytochrome [Maribacter halichondriae]|uniref:c-type cytochrome n=1 Tax=Maribacter halichondriae TaxID=2980554 RepID=UPI0023583D1A|nr:hypothetical protein [Maribacter sp. Hal144]